MNVFLKSLVARMLQPASVPGYIASAIAYTGWNPGAPILQQMTVIGSGVAGLLLVFLNTKLSDSTPK
jgi:hypothetical protein